MNFNFVDEFDCSPKQYWAAFLGEAYNVELYEKALKSRRQILAFEDDGKLLRRVVRYEPSAAVPRALQSVIPDLAYTETDVLDWPSGVMLVSSESAALKEAFRLSATYAVTALDGGQRCRRTFKGDLKVSLKLVGAVAEEWLASQMRHTTELSTQVLRRSLT